MDYTEKALYEKLIRAGFGKAASAAVIARLLELGIIDDRRYAERMAETARKSGKIFAIMFTQRISKSQQLTNWENDVLTDKQKLYAATDAWACLKIYNELNQR